MTEIYELNQIWSEGWRAMINVDRKPENPNKSVWAKDWRHQIKRHPESLYQCKNLAELRQNGSGKIVSENSLAAGSLALSIGGSGSMDLDIKGDQLKLKESRQNGFARICHRLRCLCYGSGNLTALIALWNCQSKSKRLLEVQNNVTNTLMHLLLESGSKNTKATLKNTQRKVYGSGSVDGAFEWWSLRSIRQSRA